MRKHLVILCGVYYPDPSPTGKCARQYAALLQDRFDVSVVFIQSKGAPAEGLSFHGQTIYSVCGRRLALEYGCRGGITRKLVKGVGAVEGSLSLSGNLRFFELGAYKKLVRLHACRPIDVVFSLCSPFAGHLAAMRFKKAHPEVRFVTYTVDSFATVRKNIPLAALERAERNVYNTADYNLFSEEMISARSELTRSLCKPFTALPYMLPEKVVDCTYSAGFDRDHIHLVYAGRFYEDIRNPRYMLETFLALKNRDARLHIFGGRGCESIVRTAAAQSDGRIILHDPVSPKNIQTVYEQADFVVNIENTIPEYKPSKVFEYIVSGRPILNFYHADQVDEVLLRHPACLQLGDRMKVADAAMQADAFLASHAGVVTERSIIESIYFDYSPEKIREILLHSMEMNQ